MFRKWIQTRKHVPQVFPALLKYSSLTQGGPWLCGRCEMCKRESRTASSKRSYCQSSAAQSPSNVKREIVNGDNLSKRPRLDPPLGRMQINPPNANMSEDTKQVTTKEKSSAVSKEQMDEAIVKLIKKSANDAHLSRLLREVSANKATKTERKEYGRYIGEIVKSSRRQKVQGSIVNATNRESKKILGTLTLSSRQCQERRSLERGCPSSISSLKPVERAPSLSVSSVDSLLKSPIPDVGAHNADPQIIVNDSPNRLSNTDRKQRPKENDDQSNSTVTKTSNSQSNLVQSSQSFTTKLPAAREPTSLTINVNNVLESFHILKAKDDEISKLRKSLAIARALGPSPRDLPPKAISAKENPVESVETSKLERELSKLRLEQQAWLKEKADLYDQLHDKNTGLETMQAKESEVKALAKQVKDLISKNNERRTVAAVEIGALKFEVYSREVQISQLKGTVRNFEAEVKTLTTRLTQLSQEAAKRTQFNGKDPVPYIPILHRDLLTGLPFGVNQFNRKAKRTVIKYRRSRKQTFDQRLANNRAERAHKPHVEPIRWGRQQSHRERKRPTRRISVMIEPRELRSENVSDNAMTTSRRTSRKMVVDDSSDLDELACSDTGKTARKTSRKIVTDDSSDPDYCEDESESKRASDEARFEDEFEDDDEDEYWDEITVEESDEDQKSVEECITVQDMQNRFEEALGVPRPAVPTLSVDKRLAYRRGGSVRLPVGRKCYFC